MTNFTKITPRDYLQTLKNRGIIPNFYCSEAYFEAAGFDCYVVKNWAVVIDPESGWNMFPPVRYNISLPNSEDNIIDEIWCDFHNKNGAGIGFYSEKMDYEYIYNPIQFLDISGSSWATYRKNIRKWPKHNPNWRYTHELNSYRNLRRLFVDWVRERGGSFFVEDFEVMREYVLKNLPGVEKRYLYDDLGELKGVNIWDSNYYYINFRYNVVRTEPFLSEFMRYTFYTSPDIILTGKLVNDGGSLDNPNLERFKDKLNPIEKRIRKTWSN